MEMWVVERLLVCWLRMMIHCMQSDDDDDADKENNKKKRRREENPKSAHADANGEATTTQ